MAILRCLENHFLVVPVNLYLDETMRFYSVQNLEICLAKESYANRKWPKEGSCSSPSSIVSPYFKPTSIHLMTMKLAMRLLLVLPHRLFLDFSKNSPALPLWIGHQKLVPLKFFGKKNLHIFIKVEETKFANAF